MMCKSSLFAAVVALLAAACSSKSGAPATTNGVDDVAQACAIRSPWKMTAPACTTCIAEATSPKCDCETASYAGECSGQQAAQTNEPTCDGVADCRSKCAQTDCACVDACYAGKDACRKVAAAVDGCVAAACDSSCR